MSRRPENPLILSENPRFEGSDRGTTLVASFSSRSDVVAEPLEVDLNVHPPLKPLPSRSLAKIQFPISKFFKACSQQAGLTPVYYTNDAQTTVYKSGDVNVINAKVKWAANGYSLPTEMELEDAARGGLSIKHFSIIL